jgi:hypothetical protein
MVHTLTARTYTVKGDGPGSSWDVAPHKKKTENKELWPIATTDQLILQNLINIHKTLNKA